MRNLKRALSLALATIMTMGLMVVGTGASYQDVKATDNVEAIEVLQAVGIMTGDENGDFNPDANVTRNEIAVVMSNLLNLDYDYYRGTNPFVDVPDWAAPYVAACAAEGVVAGIGNNMYGGSNNVTAAQAALMIMKALGYFQYQADFDNDWQIATIRQASYINLFDNINANAETALTRNQIAQLVLNGLKANMVTFTGTVGTEIKLPDGTTWNSGYVAEYTAVTNANKKYDSIDTGTSNIGKDDKFYVQLGEELYNGDLKLTDDTDVFGRPARYWEYDGKEIGTYVNTDLLVQEYTTKVTGDTLYNLLSRNTVEDYTFDIVIDGEYEAPSTSVSNVWFTKNAINRNNDATLGGTGNGVLTQVFVDNEEDVVTIAIINTFLAIADDDYNEKKDSAPFNVYGAAKSGDVYYKSLTTGDDQVSMTASAEDFDIEEINGMKNEFMGASLEDFKSVYISEDENVWRGYLSIRNDMLRSPVTVFLYSHHTFPVKQKGLRRTFFDGYSKVETFQMPDYSLMPPEVDHRRTLYWNPSVTVGKDGRAAIDIYNNSSCKRLAVSAEGIAPGGQPMVYRQIIEKTNKQDK